MERKFKFNGSERPSALQGDQTTPAFSGYLRWKPLELASHSFSLIQKDFKIVVSNKLLKGNSVFYSFKRNPSICYKIQLPRMENSTGTRIQSIQRCDLNLS
jgi:hypothetical protein